MNEVKRCGDCGCLEGELHEPGCDLEKCPFCGGQLISCGCAERMFYPDFSYCTDDPFCGLPEEVYKHGLSEEQWNEWIDKLFEAGPVPYIEYPNMCACCGELWPDMFKVPDEEWNFYIEIGERDKMLCRKCYDRIKELIDGVIDKC